MLLATEKNILTNEFVVFCWGQLLISGEFWEKNSPLEFPQFLGGSTEIHNGTLVATCDSGFDN
jgi:hypothetical protein